MKKSELKAYIKEEILSTLTTEGVWSRGTDVEIQQFITAVDRLKSEFYDVVGSDDVFNGLDQAISAAQELATMNESTEEEIAKTKELTAAVKDLEAAKKEAGIEEDLNEAREYDADAMEALGFDLYPGGRNEAFRYATEELGVPADEILGKISDDVIYNAIHHSLQVMGMYSIEEKVNEEEEKEPTASDLKKTKGLAKAAEELAILTKEMKALARDYKKAEGKEKEKIVADLKKKTKIKKELEAIVDK